MIYYLYLLVCLNIKGFTVISIRHSMYVIGCPLWFLSLQMVGMVIGAGIAIVLIAILIFFILRRIQLRSQ